MKNLILKVFLGNQTKLNMIAVLLVLGFVGLGCPSFGKKNDTNTVNVATSPSPTPTTAPTSRTVTKKSDASKYEVPADDEMNEMTRTSLMDFDAAVKDGDFSDFHSKISKTWQKQTSVDKFNQAFSEFIEKKVDISAVDTGEPQYSPDPSVQQDLGMRKLIAKGCYDTSPRDVNFTLKWIPEGKEWKLFGIEVDTTGTCR